MVAHVCCKRLFLMFHMFFQMYVAYISHICWKRFIWMLRMFAMIFKCFQVFFFKCFSYFGRMLHVSSRCCKSRSRSCTCREQERKASSGGGSPTPVGGPHVHTGSEASEGGPHEAAQANEQCNRPVDASVPSGRPRTYSLFLSHTSRRSWRAVYTARVT
jgi:hypothetical protein